jgi:NAD-dependent dihydropyrimidine dehydrogenase PreA subunit
MLDPRVLYERCYVFYGKCSDCGLICELVRPVLAIFVDCDEQRVSVSERCLNCATCVAECPAQACRILI